MQRVIYKQEITHSEIPTGSATEEMDARFARVHRNNRVLRRQLRYMITERDSMRSLVDVTERTLKNYGMVVDSLKDTMEDALDKLETRHATIIEGSREIHKRNWNLILGSICVMSVATTFILLTIFGVLCPT